MQDKLIIEMNSNPRVSPSWMLMSAAGELRCSTYQGEWEVLAAVAQEKEITVLVPAEDVLLTTVTLPKMSRARLQQALPFALEEQVIAEVDTLQVVCAEQQAEGEWPVAVVAKEKMQQWLEQLQAFGIAADYLLPISLALPVQANTWHIFIHQRAVVRMGFMQGFGCENERLVEWLAALAIAQQPTAICVHHYSQPCYAQALRLINKEAEIHEEKRAPEQWLMDLAVQLKDPPVVNLLQGAYASKKVKFPRREKIYKAMIAMGAAFMALLFLYPTVSYFILKQRLAQIDGQITAIYQRHFPQASSMIAPQLRMQEKLQQVTAQSSDSLLLRWLAEIGKGMTAVPGIDVRRLDFQQNQLTLELSAVSSATMTRFTEFLIRQNMKVKQQNANFNNHRLDATLMIEQRR